jgi:hypothetical protein
MEAQEHKFKVIGTRPIRHDGVDKVTGRAKYGADISRACRLSPVVDEAREMKEGCRYEGDRCRVMHLVGADALACAR